VRMLPSIFISTLTIALPSFALSDLRNGLDHDNHERPQKARNLFRVFRGFLCVS
jgi:hypothetical protein